MFRQISTVALVVLAALGSLAVATAAGTQGGGRQDEKPAEGTHGGPGQGREAGDGLDPGGRVHDGLARFGQGRSCRREAAAPGSDHQAVLPGQVSGDAGAVGSRDGQQPEPLQGSEEPGGDGQLGRLPAVSGQAQCEVGRATGASSHCPREAQWEYACRAGSTDALLLRRRRDRHWANMRGTGRTRATQTHPVGEKKPNAWGLYDMHGNVWEWCQDWYDGGYYAKSPTDDPTGPATGSNRVFRGGCWGRRGRGAAGRRTASATGPGAVAATWASASPWFRRTSRKRAVAGRSSHTCPPRHQPCCRLVASAITSSCNLGIVVAEDRLVALRVQRLHVFS